MQFRSIVYATISVQCLIYGAWLLLPGSRLLQSNPDEMRSDALLRPAHSRTGKFELADKCPSTATMENITAEAISKCTQHHPMVWSYILRHHVTPPSTEPYTFRTGQGMSEHLPIIWPILQRMVKGKQTKTFVEAGANDGVNSSHTVWLEESQGWSGVLIECHPEVLPSLRRTNRKAFIVDACLSMTEYPAITTLKSVNGWNPSSSLLDGNIFPDLPNRTFTRYQVQTLPLYAILKALHIDVVDFFSLDIQALEPFVLQTFPFDLIHVKVWVVEVILLSEQDKAGLVHLMSSKGYIASTMLGKGVIDLVFISTAKNRNPSHR